MDRRTFIKLSSLATAGVVTGCAINPVTGRRQLMLMSQAEEIALDKAHSPHQFSADYGASQDSALNQYIAKIGTSLAALSHRPEMPYSFRTVNAVYINAYAFPGGSIALTRGIVLSLDDEAQLAALLGHEIGHVNARHTATRMTKQILLGTALFLGTSAIATKNEKAAPWVAALGSIGAGALLAHYSRDDEREADALGLEYMKRVQYDPQGMVGLMDLLRSLSSYKPNALEKMFSTHPMSEERYRTAVKAAAESDSATTGKIRNRERFMDRTANLRKLRPVIENLQNGQKEMAGEKYSAADGILRGTVQKASEDYTALVMTAQCQIALEKPQDALHFLERARKAYPREALAVNLSGVSRFMQKRYEQAYNDFHQYETMLPGNPGIIFMKGFTQEAMDHKSQAASEYQRFLQQVTSGDEADHARQRLTEWGYLGSDQVS
mgnify:CR=1 FL=1